VCHLSILSRLKPEVDSLFKKSLAAASLSNSNMIERKKERMNSAKSELKRHLEIEESTECERLLNSTSSFISTNKNKTAWSIYVYIL